MALHGQEHKAHEWSFVHLCALSHCVRRNFLINRLVLLAILRLILLDIGLSLTLLRALSDDSPWSVLGHTKSDRQTHINTNDETDTKLTLPLQRSLGDCTSACAHWICFLHAR